MGEIPLKVAVMTSSVPKISSFVSKVTFVVAQITFKLTSVADISLLVTKITVVVAEIKNKEDVSTFYVAKIICKVAVVTSSVA